MEKHDRHFPRAGSNAANARGNPNQVSGKPLFKAAQTGATRPLYPIYLHPLVAFGLIWLVVCFLYALRLSELIMYPASEVLRFDEALLAAAFGGSALAYIIPRRVVMPVRWRLVGSARSVALLDRRLSLWFKIWCIVTVVEIIYSRGIPTVWLFTGNAKTYMDFGIPTIHGFMNSLLQAICLVRLGMGIRFGRKKDFLYPAWAVVWSMIVITRQLMMVFLLEVVVVYCTYRQIRVKRVLGALLGVLCLVYVFGVVGDLRTGAEQFRAFAQPTSAYPDWLPSGFLWFYMYLSTPINNLLYTFHTTQPLYDWRFPNTLSELLPTVLRKMFVSADTLAA